jgi:hypothetical protein
MELLSRILLFSCLILTSPAKTNPELPTENVWIKSIVQKLSVADCYWALDNNGDLCLTGYFLNSATFENQKLVAVGKFDVFVAKYSKTGELLWVKQAGGSEPDFVKLIKIDANNNIYITGYFTSISFFENYIAHSKGRTDVFTAKYSPTGELIWVKSKGAEIICEPNPVKRKALLQKMKQQ